MLLSLRKSDVIKSMRGEDKGEKKRYYLAPELESSIWSPGYLSLFFCLLLSVFLVSFYFYHIKPYVFLPADILMWAETNFVGDIIKIRIGAPIYTDPIDSNAGIYAPASPLLTYAISWIIGRPTSIITWRVIQLGFVFFAALIATVCCRILHRLAYPHYQTPFRKTWLVFAFLALFLSATAPRTSGFVHCLHADALALLVSMISFWTMLHYLKRPSWGRMVLMAVCPALGYLTKQFLISWFAVMFVVLLLDNPKNIRRLFLFIGTGGVFLGIAIGVCYLLWGDSFIFWTFKIMGGGRSKIAFSVQGFHVSLVRSLDHVIRAWSEIVIGVAGGWLILRGDNIRKLGPLWVGWIVLVCSEAYTSGAGWGALYHFGPAVVIGTVWLFSALPRFWAWNERTADGTFSNLLMWTRACLGIIGVLTLFIAMNVLPTGDKNGPRYWYRRPSPDIYRYISDIEKEFDSFPMEKVLLDIGNWIYLSQSVLAKDRAISLGDQAPNGIYENFDMMVSRIRNKTYLKILVRDFHSPFFLYDWTYWERPSGVKKALLKHYQEVRIIPAAEREALLSPIIMHSGPVSVLIPKLGSKPMPSTER